MKLQKELKTAKKAAREAGRIAREYRKKGADSWSKGEHDFVVTEADIDCQEKIVEIISSKFPEDGFLAEEEGLEPEGEKRIWVIDPIDGTNNYAHGLNYYCVSIALKIDGEIELGVIHAPELDEMFHAVKGSGAYLNDNSIEVSSTSDLPDSLVITILSTWEENLRDPAANFLKEMWDVGASFRKPGSAALDLCQLAAGRLDGYVAAALHKWDFAAGALIVKEAGGKVRWKNSVVGGLEEMVASNGKIQGCLEELFDRSFRS
ncbi:MAG: inositol monophosphatase family protein [Candidatus Nanohaloarchaea archaeon]|nr:inositol monophosphatase family protein [Candidatus Nanohaloarchaea archaeon]